MFLEYYKNSQIYTDIEGDVDMNNRQILRAYSINEVSKRINTPSGTIRQWEKDLEGLLVIPRTQQGARYYTDNEINILHKIKEMRSQNISKGMIRSLLEKHLQKEAVDDPVSEKPASEVASETLKTANLTLFQRKILRFHLPNKNIT